MKQFFIKLIIFGILLSICCVYLFSKRSHTYVDKFLNINHNFDIINLGTSHGSGIFYENMNGAGFQRAGNTLYYDLQNYRYLRKYLNPKSLVIIPVSYFSFGLDENRTDYDDSDAFVNDFYFYLPSKNIFNYSLNKEIQVYLNRVRENYHSVIDERFFFEEKKDLTDTIDKKQKLNKSAIKRINEHKFMATYSDQKKNIIYLSNLISEIQDDGHKVVLLTMPYYKDYTFGFEKKWLQENYFNYIQIIIDSFDIAYLRYDNDQRFILNDSLFYNSDHFNLNGMKKFNEILFNDLKNIGVVDY